MSMRNSSQHSREVSSTTSATDSPQTITDFSSAEVDLYDQLESAFPKRQSQSKRADLIRKNYALSREIRQKLRAAEKSFRDLGEFAAVGDAAGAADDSPVSKASTGSTAPNSPSIASPSVSCEKSVAKMKKKRGMTRFLSKRSITWHP